MEQNEVRFDKFIHMSRLRRGSRRVVALALAAVMCGGLLPVSTLAANAVWPIQAVINVEDPTVDPGIPDGSGEAPTITIEANGVIDESNKLTGFLEVAIRVKPGVLHLAADGSIVKSTLDPNYDHSETQPFSSLAVALEYSDKLTPWEWEKLDGNWDKLDVSIPANQTAAVDLSSAVGEGFSARRMVEVDPLHKSTRIAHATISPKGAVGDGGTSTVADGDADSGVTTPTVNAGGYLYLMAEGFTAKDFNNEDTVLAVVRFKYERDADDDTKNPWSTMFPQGANNPAATDWIDPSSPNCLVKLTDAVTLQTPLDPIEEWEVVYNSGKSVTRPQGNRFYYSTDTDDGMEAYDPDKPTTDPDYASTTSNCMEVATVDTVADTPSTTTVVPGKINYTLVNRLSYNFAGGDPNDFATILFYDWDDVLIGTLVVKKDVDSRKRVNDYVREHFIYTDGNNVEAGDDTNLSLQDNTDATISSLEREDNYRGKYTTTPQALNTDGTVNDDGTVCNGVNGNPDGTDFPLTNKLDYVFFKRPMERDEATKPNPDTYAGGNTDADYLADLAEWSRHWKQAVEVDASTGDETPAWDTEYPYIYGWAEVEDYAHPEDVWTTMGGKGELSNYTDYTIFNGGNVTNAGAPAELTVEEGYDFSFADFDFSENVLTENCLAVKAVYEPGVDCLDSSVNYRLITEPYYNKLTYKDAAIGGAYSVETTFERSDYAVTGNLRGVMRTREPYIRQDNSYDTRWINIPEKNIKNDLPLNENSELYSDKYETMYTKVEVANVDVINFTMALSARQNKLDFYLIEGYGESFVSGSTKIDSELVRDAAYRTVDNYNYFFDPSTVSDPSNASDLTDEYYDVRSYDEREGSHGFVLYGTINNLMEQSIKVNHNELDSATYRTYVSSGNLNDINLKMAGNTDPGYADIIMTVIPAFEEAAKQAEAAHNSGNDTWWDVEHNIPNLSYHQIQWFLLDYINNPSATLRTASAAFDASDSTTYISWCHLHEACVNSVSSKPTTWNDLMDAAYAGDTAKLELLAASDVERNFRLRNNTAGTPLTAGDLPTFISDLQAVVQALTAQTGGTNPKVLTWDQVQYALLNGTGDGSSLSDMDDYGSNNYWWYDGATDPAIGSWTSLGAAVKEAAQNLSTNTMPDGRTVNGRHAKLNQLQSAFGATDTTAWIAATRNLCAADANAVSSPSGIKFNSFDDFKAAAIDGWEAANNAATPVTSPSWEQIQYHVIHKDDAGYAFPDDPSAIETETDTYFWKDGNEKIVDLKSLLSAAKNNTSAWQSLPQSAITQFKFASAFDGTAFSSIDDFKAKVKAYADAASDEAINDPDWNAVQYHICFGAVPGNANILSTVAGYFWWNIGDGTPQKVNFSTSGTTYPDDYPADADEVAAAIMDAAFRAKYNGNTAAWDDFTEAVARTGRLAADYTGSETDFNSDFTLFGAGDLETVKNLAVALLQNKYTNLPNAFTPDPPTAIWEELQYALLNGGAYDPNILFTNDYWWKAADTAGSSPSADLAQASTYLQAIAGGDADALTDMQSWFTDDVAKNLKIDDAGDGSGSSFADYGIDLSTFPWDCLDYSGATWPITYPQLMAIFLQIAWEGMDPSDGSMAVMSNTDALDYIDSMGFPDASQDPGWTSFATFNMPQRAPLRVPTVNDLVPEPVKEISEDGRTETTTVITKVYNEETQNYDTTTVVTAITRVPAGDKILVTTTVTTIVVTIDPDTGEIKVDTDSDTTTSEEEAPPAEAEKPVESEKPVDPEEKPTDPEEKPTDPEEKPTEPEEKPTDPEEKPTEPEEKPTDPEEKPTEPEEKPTDPEETPTDPEETPTDPEEKPTDPEEKPTEPGETPTEPEDIGSTDPPIVGIVKRTRAKRMNAWVKAGNITAIQQYILGREGPPLPMARVWVQQGMGLEAVRRIHV